MAEVFKMSEKEKESYLASIALSTDNGLSIWS